MVEIDGHKLCGNQKKALLIRPKRYTDIDCCKYNKRKRRLVYGKCFRSGIKGCPNEEELPVFVEDLGFK